MIIKSSPPLIPPWQGKGAECPCIPMGPHGDVEPSFDLTDT